MTPSAGLPGRSADLVLTERIGAVTVLRMNRLGAANALDVPLQRALTEQLALARDAADVGAVVLGSAPNAIFSAGADLKEYQLLLDTAGRQGWRGRLCETLVAILDFPKPLVACVSGKAIGAGCMVSFLCDEIVASDNASFSLPEVRLGMPSPLSATIAGHRGPRSFVQAMVLGAEAYSAQRCSDAQIIDLCVAPDALQDTALRRAKFLSQLPQLAYGSTKAWHNRELRCAIFAAIDESSRIAQG